jgi:hypothetical protein
MQSKIPWRAREGTQVDLLCPSCSVAREELTQAGYFIAQMRYLLRIADLVAERRTLNALKNVFQNRDPIPISQAKPLLAMGL